jgi:hypothetical protein
MRSRFGQRSWRPSGSACGGASAGLRLVSSVLQFQRTLNFTSLEVLLAKVHVPQTLDYDKREIGLLQIILKYTAGGVVHFDSSPR